MDVAIGLNAASPYPDEARVFLQWLTTPDFGKILGDGMPGFFPMHRQDIILDNAYANTFLNFSRDYATNIRFTWKTLQTGDPSGYTLIYEGTRNVISGKQSPEQAAIMLQSELATWLPVAQTCSK